MQSRMPPPILPVLSVFHLCLIRGSFRIQTPAKIERPPLILALTDRRRLAILPPESV